MKKNLYIVIPIVLLISALSFAVSIETAFSADDPSKPEKKDGECGPAAREYTVEESAFGGKQCERGEVQGFSTFPPPGKSASWTCSGVNGGNPSKTCTAKHLKLTRVDKKKNLDEALKKLDEVLKKEGIKLPQPPKSPPPKKGDDLGWKIEGHGPVGADRGWGGTWNVWGSW